MAVSSQKFLPSGKSGSLAVMPAAKLSMIRKPLVATSSDGEAKKTVVDIHKKVTSLTFIFRKSRILTKKIIRRKRKSAEIEENRKREEKLEERKKSVRKDTKNDRLLVTPPGGSIVDSLTRFAGFTLLGFVVDKYSSILPKLIEFGKFIQPAVEIFGSFAQNLVGNTINFIETGYKAYDTVNDIVKKIGGENYEKMFSSFSSAFNLFLQASLLTGIAGFGGGLVKKPQVVEETIKSGKSILSGDTGISQLRKKEIFRQALRNKNFAKERRNDIAKITRKNKVRGAQRLQELKSINDAKKNQRKERAKKARGEVKVKATRPSEPGKIIGAKTTRKPPNTLRLSKLMYTDPTGGYKVDFGLPGQPTKRLSPEVAEGIKYMFENPKDRYTKQIAYEAFKYPDLYESDIKANYREYRKSLFDKSKLIKPTGKSASATTVKQVGKQAAKRSAKGLARIIPFIGPLVDIVISLIAGDPLDEAVVGAAGAALGGFVGGALAGAGTFGIGSVLGIGIGSFVGDIFSRSLYQAAKGFVFKPKAYASGGQVTRGGEARGAVSRDIKTNIKDIKAKKIQTVTPQQTVVGKNAYLGESKEGDKMISNYQKIYGEAGLRALKDSSRDVKKIKFMQNIWGALGGAYIDMLLGQRPDSSLASDIGSIIGAMTNERHGRKVSQELSISLENSANNIFRHLYAAAGVERPAMDTKFGNRAPSPDGTQADVRGIDPKGEVIGYVGYTGNVRPKGPDGAHIHIETGMGRGGAGGAIPASVLKNIIVGGKPLSDWPRTSGIGMRESGMHYGLDYGIPAGTPITLSGGLKFVEYAAGENAGYGNLVVVSDGAGNKYLLGHLSGGPPNPEALKKKETVAPVKKVSSSGLNQQTSYELAIHERSVYFYQQETVLA